MREQTSCHVPTRVRYNQYSLIFYNCTQLLQLSFFASTIIAIIAIIVLKLKNYFMKVSIQQVKFSYQIFNCFCIPEGSIDKQEDLRLQVDGQERFSMVI